MIPIEEFQQRRQRLLAQMADNSVAVFPAAAEQTRSRDTEFPFRQDSDFFYLTGFCEPDAVLLLSKAEQNQVLLLCRPKDTTAEIWQGRRLGPELAQQQLALDAAQSNETLEEALRESLNGKSTLYYAEGVYAEFDRKIADTLGALRSGPKKGWKAPSIQIDSRTLLHEMRLFKSDAEQAQMRKAAQISIDAHIRAMRFSAAGRYEYQLQAEIEHEFAIQGARHPAYGTIVGSGDNACILHYTENSDPLADGDLVLIDAGGEYQGYAADITRTFPANGRFSEPQKQLYQLVLDTQLAVCAAVKPGATFDELNALAIRQLTAGLLQLGLLQGELESLIEAQAVKAFYMHGIGHWLGLDVHDVGEYKLEGQARPLQPGMVLTIEPGLYIATDAEVAPQWRGMGIRIEDNLLVTADGHENLTDAAPKTIAAIEALMVRDDG